MCSFSDFHPFSIRSIFYLKEKSLRKLNRDIDVPLTMHQKDRGKNFARIVALTPGPPVIANVLNRPIASFLSIDQVAQAQPPPSARISPTVTRYCAVLTCSA